MDQKNNLTVWHLHHLQIRHNRRLELAHMEPLEEALLLHLTLTLKAENKVTTRIDLSPPALPEEGIRELNIQIANNLSLAIPGVVRLGHGLKVRVKAVIRVIFDKRLRGWRLQGANTLTANRRETRTHAAEELDRAT